MAGRKRHLLKAITYRLFGSLFTFLAGWLLTDRLEIGLSLFGLDAVGKIVLYYIHERLWDRITWL